MTTAVRTRRGAVPELEPGLELRTWVPAVYAEDEFLQHLLGGLDAVLAPVLSTLENLASYLDADLTPEDFLPWLGSWVGLRVDERWPVERRRAVVGHGGQTWSGRATLRALGEMLALALGPDVDVSDNGGVSYATTPRAPLPGDPQPRLHVRLPSGADGGDGAVQAWVTAIVDEFRPVHVPAVIESSPGDGAP